MKLLEKLKLGRKQKQLPIKTVRPPGEARRARGSAEQGGPPSMDQRKEPTISSVLDDTGSLELEHNLAHEPSKNPYDTQSQHRDSNGALRQVDVMTAANRDKKASAGRDNPYDKSFGRKRR
jgi:hypothetical protein